LPTAVQAVALPSTGWVDLRWLTFWVSVHSWPSLGRCGHIFPEGLLGDLSF
jgi:hypothetical protein